MRYIDGGDWRPADLTLPNEFSINFSAFMYVHMYYIHKYYIYNIYICTLIKMNHCRFDWVNCDALWHGALMTLQFQFHQQFIHTYILYNKYTHLIYNTLLVGFFFSRSKTFSIHFKSNWIKSIFFLELFRI